MTPQARANFRQKLAWTLSILLTLALLAPVYFKRLVNVEASWRAALSWAFTHNAHFGSDFIFTYGPWGFALSDFYEPDTWKLQVLVKAFLILAVALPMAALSRWRPVHALGLTLAALVIAHAQALDALLYTLPLLFLVTTGPLLFLLAIAMALASLTKFTVLVISPLAIITALLFHRPRPFLPAAAYAIALLLFWLLAGQPLSTLPAFLTTSLEIIGAYSEMVGLFTQSTLSIQLCYFSIILLFLLRALLHFKHNRHASTLPFAAAALLILLFKANFVRDDEPHLLVATSTALLFSLLVAAQPSKAPPPKDPNARPSRLHLATTLPPILLAVLAFALSNQTTSFLPGLASTARTRLAALANPSTIASNHQALQRNTLAARLLPDLPGTVDLFGLRQRLLFLSGLHYTPRPIFQSYAAGTPHLADLNLRFLQTSPPDHLLLQFQPLDDNFPLLEDALCYREMLTRYEPQALSPTWLTLKRSPTPRTFQLEKIASQTVSLNQSIPLPQSGPIWAEITYTPSLTGKLRQNLYKIPPMDLILLTGDKAERFRLNRFLTPAGFLISPRVITPADFAALYTSPQTLSAPASLTLTTAAPNAYQPTAEITLYRLVYPLLPLPTTRD